MCERQQEFENLNTKIFIISFSTFPAVQAWLKETCSDFTVLLDSEREVYKAYKLERSYWRSRNLRTRWAYLQAWLAGKKRYDSHGEDTNQLGGDFMIDTQGIIRFAHPSHDPTDRPPVDELINQIKQL